jgi:hypothetical protein
MRGLSWKNKADFGLKAQGCPSKDHQGAHLLDFLGNECLGKSMDPKNKAIAPQDGSRNGKKSEKASHLNGHLSSPAPVCGFGLDPQG